MNQNGYNLAVETGQNSISTDSFVQYFLYYQNKVNPDSRFLLLNRDRQPVYPYKDVCVNNVKWWQFSDDQFVDIDTLTSHLGITVEQAGMQEWSDCVQAGCNRVGPITVEKACYRYLEVPLRSEKEFQYKASVDYARKIGDRLRRLTSNGNL